MLNQNRVELVKLATEIAGRYCVTPERIETMLTFAMAVKFSVNYRTVLHSSAGCLKLWDYIDTKTNVLDAGFMDVLLSMTSEFIFLGGLDNDILGQEIAGPLAKTLSWSKSTGGTPLEIAALTATHTDYQETIAKNPWAAFVYMVGMSDLVRLLTHLKAQFPA